MIYENNISLNPELETEHFYFEIFTNAMHD